MWAIRTSQEQYKSTGKAALGFRKRGPGDDSRCVREQEEHGEEEDLGVGRRRGACHFTDNNPAMLHTSQWRLNSKCPMPAVYMVEAVQRGTLDHECSPLSWTMMETWCL